ncbi:pyridoxal phosphate-dependent aminotransferase [Sporolactobacillus shoreicorticis]|uniref:cysteine-S-conjugate beta-lyase n=1 Tax=Sporolactobacillus shoreicorticis TaxID=1923877 RepID=A0ABW5RZN7_9BACL|nr:MalY/PatB family protein [Sporolactobacillus shoreicorticis]MCO7126822.1 pyridoxal phosphate-dependent aminotransferase [Sporolactobacillus shoreicorticis]
MVIVQNYDFDQVTDRNGTASIKWDEADRLFGGEHLIPLWVADMDFQVPAEITEALSNRIQHAIYGYTSASEDYYQIVKQWMAHRHQWAIKKEWICHSPGVVTALNLIVDGFTCEGDKVLIQSPVYPPFAKSALNQNRELVTNPLINDNGVYRMDFVDLEHKLSNSKVSLMILCSPHNPVGRVWTKRELAKVAELANKYDVLVVADEIHHDLVFEGHHHTPYALISEEASDHSIICTAPSKTFNLAGLQISNIIIPNSSLRRKYLKQVRRFGLGEPNTLGVTAAEAAYRFGESWLDQCLTYIKKNANFVTNFLKKNLPDLKMTPIEGTYLGWIDCRKLGWDKLRLQQFLIKEAGLALNQGYAFGTDGEGFVRINLACPQSLLKEAMNQLQSAFQHHL